MITLQQIIYALKIAECGSMNKAAEELFVAQPTLTNAVHQLENEVNMQLFVRTPKGIIITREGGHFLDDARQFYNQYQLLSETYSGNEKKRTFSLSTQHFSFAVKCFVNTLIKLGYENYKFSVYETRTLDVIQNVGKSISDIGVLYLSKFNQKYIRKLLEEYNLEFTTITKCDACVYLHKNHPLAKLREISLSDLENYPCLSFDQGEDNLFYLSEEILTENEFARTVKASDRATMLNLMIGLNGYTLCPGIVEEALNGDNCVIVPYKEDENNPNREMEIGYINKKNGLLSKASEVYISQLNDYFKNKNQ